jgi:glycine dehydrogenase subunit 2
MSRIDAAVMGAGSSGRPLDLTKALLDYGFMAPTMCFPLIVPERLMVEPIGTESRETP